MLYKCDHCNYCSPRRGDLRRHMNRKNPCYNKIKVNTCNSEVLQNVHVESQNVTMDQQNVHPESQNVHPELQNVHPESQNVTMDQQNVHPELQNVHADMNINESNDKQCSKCNKMFTTKYRMKTHEKTCNGIHSLQCAICLKVFATRKGKYNHAHHVKCSPPVSSELPQQQVINNNTTTTTTNNNNINNNHSVNITNNNNFNINLKREDFDKITNEDIQRLVSRLEKNEYLDMVDNNLEIGKYVIPRTVEQIYFNDNFPELQTLKKERRNDKMVEVYVGNGKWETRFVDDVFMKLIARVEAYHTEYFKHLENKYKNVKIGSARWKQLTRPIKSFGNIMLWYDGFRGDIIENMGIELNYPEDNFEMDKERERRNKEMGQIVCEKLYHETSTNKSFQCELL